MTPNRIASILIPAAIPVVFAAMVLGAPGAARAAATTTVNCKVTVSARQGYATDCPYGALVGHTPFTDRRTGQQMCRFQYIGGTTEGGHPTAHTVARQMCVIQSPRPNRAIPDAPCTGCPATPTSTKMDPGRVIQR